MLNTQPEFSIQGRDASTNIVRRWMSVLAKLASIVVCSQLFALDWIDKDGWWLSWLSMAGFVLVVSRSKPVEAALYGLIMGLLGLGASFWWAQDMLAYVLNVEGSLPKMVFAGLIAWETIIFVVVGSSIAALRRSGDSAVGLFIPMCAWIAIEAYLPRVFRWSLGHSQLGALPLVQAAELGGPSMVSILVLAAACIPTLILDWLMLRGSLRSLAARNGLAIAFTIVVLFISYGLIRVQSIDSSMGKNLRIGVVQEDPATNDGIPRMRNGSLSLGPVDLLVWPESTLGIHAFSLSSFSDPEGVVKSSKPPHISAEPLMGLPSPLIVGGRSFDGTPDQSVPEYQTAFLLSQDGSILERYHKRSLMPIGEYVPGEEIMPWLHNWFQLGQYTERGKSDDPLSLPGGEKIGVIICYEDTMAEVTRKTVAAGAELLVCIINDSAFQSPVALRQHLKLSRLRAIENRRYFVRCAGTGVSCVVSPSGHLHHTLDADETGAFAADVRLLSGSTPFQLLGEWPPMVASAIVVFYLLRDHYRSRRKRTP
jgi:apolipoprotein N-acyltransferase